MESAEPRGGNQHQPGVSGGGGVGSGGSGAGAGTGGAGATPRRTSSRSRSRGSAAVTLRQRQSSSGVGPTGSSPEHRPTSRGRTRGSRSPTSAAAAATAAAVAAVVSTCSAAGGGGGAGGGATTNSSSRQSQLRKATASSAPASVSAPPPAAATATAASAPAPLSSTSSPPSSSQPLSPSSPPQPSPSGRASIHRLQVSSPTAPVLVSAAATGGSGGRASVSSSSAANAAASTHQIALRHLHIGVSVSGGSGTGGSGASSGAAAPTQTAASASGVSARVRSASTPRLPLTAGAGAGTAAVGGGMHNVGSAGAGAVGGAASPGGAAAAGAGNPFAPSTSAAAGSSSGGGAGGGAAETFRPAGLGGAGGAASGAASFRLPSSHGALLRASAAAAATGGAGGGGLGHASAPAVGVGGVAALAGAGVGVGGGGGGGAAVADSSSSSSAAPRNRGWIPVPALGGGTPPCQRSLHASAVLHTSLYVFGGYDGQSRINDFHSYSFPDGRWSPVLPAAGSGPPPSPRDRHVAVVWGDGFYVFGGFDGTSRVADFYGFDMSSMTWSRVTPRGGGGGGSPPSPRHSHSAVVWEDSMFVFGGYDGSYRSDFHEYNFQTRTWSPVPSTGRTPRARYRATCVVHRSTMILFGGHDGTRHLSDTHLYDFDARTWSAVVTEGPPPIPRDSHVAAVHRDSMYVFGGSTGSAMNDLHELQLSGVVGGTARWRPVDTSGAGPPGSIAAAAASGGVAGGGMAPLGQQAGHRFCHVAVTYLDSMYVFGGYDGSNRLNDFIKYDFDVDDLTCDVPPSTLVPDLRSFLFDEDGEFEDLADVTFLVEDVPVRAHKILLVRCSYFRAMFLGRMLESSQSTPIVLRDIRHPIFVLLLEYLYTDEVAIPLDKAMELFVAADRFDVPRLRAMCERKMLGSMTVDNVATVFHAADLHCAESLREKALKYILNHFESVSKTSAFEEMARSNVELVFEILRSR